MEKCWAFYRRSTDKQELSISDQRRECQAFAAKNGWEIVREFEPIKGWGSGLTIDRDPSFQEMIRAAERGGHGVRYMLVYDTSRFGRLPVKVKIFWQEYLRIKGGIKVVYVKNDFNDDSIGGFVTEAFAHDGDNQYSRKLSEVTLRGAKSHSALGHFTGGKAPYGYDRLLVDAQGQSVKVLRRGEHKADKMQRVVLAPSPTEAPIVRDIFETYDKGTGLNLITQSLNKRGIPAPRGRHWSKVMVHYMIRNRAYLGERIYNRRSYKGYRRGEKGSLFNPTTEWVVKECAHAPIVDQELFDRVQSKRKTRKFGQGRPYNRPYLLTRLAECGRCHYGMIGWPKRGNGHLYHTYTCGGYQRIGPTVCRSVNISGEELEGLALRAVREHISDPVWRKELRRTINVMIGDRFGKGAEGRHRALQRQLASVNREIANVVDAVKDGHSSATLLDELGKLEQRRDALRLDIGEFEAALLNVKSREAIVDEVMGTAADFNRSWAEAESVEVKKEILRGFIKRVRVDHGDHVVPTAHFQLFTLPQNRLAGHPQGASGHAYSLSLLRG